MGNQNSHWKSALKQKKIGEGDSRDVSELRLETGVGGSWKRNTSYRRLLEVGSAEEKVRPEISRRDLKRG